MAIESDMDRDFEQETLDRWAIALSKFWVGALWGLAEATVFFLAPDIIITASALFSPRRALLQMLAVLLGALIGGAALYTAAERYPDQAKRVVSSVPFIKASLLDRANNDLEFEGPWSMCKGAVSGVPYKTYAMTAPHYVPFLTFMLVSIPARLERLIITWGIAAWLGALFRRQIASAPTAALALHIICWIGFYTYYWSVI